MRMVAIAAPLSINCTTASCAAPPKMMIDEAYPSPAPTTEPAAVTPKIKPKGTTPTSRGATATTPSRMAVRVGFSVVASRLM